MSRTHKSVPDDDQLVRYVLGLLPDELTERLDEASIADDEVASRLRVVEDDLVDSYVRRTMDPERRERFESYYLSSPRRRERVRFAESFVHAVDGAAARTDANSGNQPKPGAPQSPGLQPRPETIPDHRPKNSRLILTWTLAAAAAVVLAASGALLNERLRHENRSNFAQDTTVATATPQSAPIAPGDVQSTAAPAPATPPVRPKAIQVPALALVLLPQTRAIAAIPTLAIPPGVDRVTFELRLESNDFSQYRAGLQDPATSQIVWRSGWTAAKSTGASSSIRVVVPAGVLKTQHYSLDLSGRGAGGSAEIVGSYAFQIVPR
jgi:hypothetical protein